jgi:hypothetical protein
MSCDMAELLEAMARAAVSPLNFRGRMMSAGTFGESELVVARRGRTWRIAPERWPDGRYFSGLPQWMPRPYEALLRRPLSIAASHVLEMGEHSGCVGRLTRVVSGSPRKRTLGQVGAPWLELGPLEVEVDVDAGLILTARSVPGGTPLFEFRTIQLDVDVSDDELRPPVQPPRPPVRTIPAEREVSLEAAAGAVAFTLYRPRLRPANAVEKVTLYPPGGAFFSGRVTLSYTPPFGRWGVAVTMMTAADRQSDQGVREDLDVVEEGGVRYEFWTNARATSVSLDRDGTHIVLGGAYSRPEILRIARSLVGVDRGRG